VECNQRALGILVGVVEITQADPQPWKKGLAAVAEQWLRYRFS